MMAHRLLRRVVIPAAALALPLAMAVSPAQASTPGWRVTQIFAGSFGLDSVAATSASNAWATGQACGNPCGPTSLLTEHWTGTQWQAIAPPSGFSTSVGSTVDAASSPSNAWVIANQGSNVDVAIGLRWNGSAWTGTHDFPAWSVLNAAVTTGKADAWVFGQIIAPFSPYAAHYNGTRWSRVRFPVTPAAASAVSARNIWVAGDTVGSSASPSTFAIMHWTGTAWHRVRLPAIKLPAGDQMHAAGVVAIGPGNVWADAFLSHGMGVTNGTVLLHWNGTAWSRVQVPYATSQPGAITQDGHGGIWLSGYGTASTNYRAFLYHDNGGHWSRVAVPHAAKSTTQLSQLSWIPGGRSVWAAGESLPNPNPDGTALGAVLKYGP